MLKADQQRVRALLTETVALLCRNGLNFKSELCIEGLIGVTLDREEIFLVNIKETVKVNSPASSNESIHARSTVEPTPSSKTARKQAKCAEINLQTSTDYTPLSTKPKQPLATSNSDDASISCRSFGSPVLPSSIKSQPEDAPLVPPPDRLSGVGVVSEHPVSFHDVPIKLDSALGSKTLPEDAFRPSEAHPDEPAQKRLRTRPQRRSTETKSIDKPPTPKMPSKLGSSNQEPANVIEIKEESLSDEELTEHSTTDYPSYDDYSTMTTYGVGDVDASQMFGESGFKTEAVFQEEMQEQTHGVSCVLYFVIFRFVVKVDVCIFGVTLALDTFLAVGGKYAEAIFAAAV